MDNPNSVKEILITNLRKYTKLSDEEMTSMLEYIPTREFRKGVVLLHQGDAPDFSYYLIKGCIRQFVIDENGREITVNFYTDEESINMFSFLDGEEMSLYSLSAIEDSVVVLCSDLDEESTEEDPDITNMKRMFFEKQFSDMQINFANFKLQTPEERFSLLYKSRPDLLERVPQIYLASYLGITPETFSRFKKRMLP